MKRKTAPRTTRTIGLKLETFTKLKAYGRMGETWDDLLNRMMHDLEFVNFQLVSIDGKSPEDHMVQYVLGNARYEYAKGQSKLLSVPS